jgi:hypothetical protein
MLGMTGDDPASIALAMAARLAGSADRGGGQLGPLPRQRGPSASGKPPICH